MVIPAPIRKKYGIRKNSSVELIDTGEEIVIIPLPDRDSFNASRGILKGVSTKDLIKSRRAERIGEKRKEKRA